MIARVRRRLPQSAAMLGLAVLVAATFALGTLGVGAIRPVFVLGCGALGAIAWRLGPARHVELTIALFALAPFLRRVVDLGAGFDSSGVMLVGPMLCILVPVLDLRALLLPGADTLRRHGAVLVYLVCALYGCLLSLFQGDVSIAATGMLKWIAPVLYGIWIAERACDTDGLVEAAARTLTVIVPVMGLYGVWQYVDPPAWDRYWMVYARMTSVGLPEPYEVRVFSIMNSPASFASYTVAGLLLIGFCRSFWVAALLAVPSCLGLMLSLYRTSWVALAAGVMFCMLFSATRIRSVLIAASIVGAIALAVVATPFGDAIGDRLQTLNKPSEDGSGQERLAEYVTIWNMPDSMLVGIGFGGADAGSPGAMPIDGMIVACWLAMGLVGGLICLAALVWASLQALTRVWLYPSRHSVALGAIVLGGVVEIPLNGIAAGEIGVVFWMAVGLASAAAVPVWSGPAPARQATAGGEFELRTRLASS